MSDVSWVLEGYAVVWSCCRFIRVDLKDFAVERYFWPVETTSRLFPDPALSVRIGDDSLAFLPSITPFCLSGGALGLMTTGLSRGDAGTLFCNVVTSSIGSSLCFSGFADFDLTLSLTALDSYCESIVVVTIAFNGLPGHIIQ